MKIGLIGAGAIAQFLLNELNTNPSSTIRVTNVFVRNLEKYEELESKYGVTLQTDLNQFLAADIDLVVEAAGVEATESLIPQVLRSKPIIIISVGAFANAEFVEELMQATNESKQKVYLPAGAIGGLDLLQNAYALGDVQHVSLTTRKPSASLVNDVITEEKIIFQGNAAEAIKLYPKNMNVSILLALASIGFEQTKVTLIADPLATQNIHHIQIIGDFGEATVEVKNNPLPSNPKTSYLAALSILGMLKKLQSSIQIG